MTPRVNRVFQFIERFPAMMRTSALSLVPVVGSSGVFRGFWPPTFDAVAAEHGRQWRSVNIGLPAIDCESTSKICNFIRQCSDGMNRRLPMAIYELDPMMLSTIPPAGEVFLTSQHFSGEIYSSSTVSDDFRWDSDTAGAPNFASVLATDTAPTDSRSQPQWQLKREQEIIKVFLGLVKMNSSAANWWLAGLQHLQAVADHVIIFVHPIDRSRIQSEPSGVSDEYWINLRSNILGEVDAKFIDWDQFQMNSSDFLDVNHVVAGRGSENLTRQLALMVFRDELATVDSVL